MKCETCPNAIWDCCEFYGATRVQKVVIGCKLDKTPEECEEKDKQCGEVGTISLDDFMVCATRYYRMAFDSGTLQGEKIVKRENMMEALRKYFSIGNSYTYELTRVKSAFEVGTISLDDFEEWGEENISDLCDYLIQELQKGE